MEVAIKVPDTSQLFEDQFSRKSSSGSTHSNSEGSEEDNIGSVIGLSKKLIETFDAQSFTQTQLIEIKRNISELVSGINKFLIHEKLEGIELHETTEEFYQPSLQQKRSFIFARPTFQRKLSEGHLQNLEIVVEQDAITKICSTLEKVNRCVESIKQETSVANDLSGYARDLIESTQSVFIKASLVPLQLKNSLLIESLLAQLGLDDKSKKQLTPLLAGKLGVHFGLSPFDVDNQVLYGLFRKSSRSSVIPTSASNFKEIEVFLKKYGPKLLESADERVKLITGYLMWERYSTAIKELIRGLENLKEPPLKKASKYQLSYCELANKCKQLLNEESVNKIIVWLKGHEAQVKRKLVETFKSVRKLKKEEVKTSCPQVQKDHLDRFLGIKPVSEITSVWLHAWSRVLEGPQSLEICHSDGKKIYSPVPHDGISKEEKKQLIERWMKTVEYCLSEKLFCNKNLIADFKIACLKTLIEKLSTDKNPLTTKDEHKSTIDEHEALFNILSPLVVNGMLDNSGTVKSISDLMDIIEKRAISEITKAKVSHFESQQLSEVFKTKSGEIKEDVNNKWREIRKDLDGIWESLKNQHPDLNISLKTFVRYLLIFYSSLYNQFTLATMYQLLLEYRDFFQYSSITAHSDPFIEIKFTPKDFSFTWHKKCYIEISVKNSKKEKVSKEIGELNYKLTITTPLPSVTTDQPQPTILEKIIYKFNTSLSETEKRKAEKVINRLNVLLEAKGYPKETLIPQENIT